MGAHSIAEELARKQKDISVAEFFERNKQILGFDSLSRSLITAVKEGVDNSLDACEEAGILPEVLIEVEALDKTEYKISVEDNGPGIVERNIPNVFARLLFGSRFHAVRQSRGQQGIGISAAVMYGQLTTAKAAKVRSKVAESNVAVDMELILDTKANRPQIIKKDYSIWDKHSGTRVTICMKGRYIAGKQSILEYLKGTAIVNPHAQISFKDPSGSTYVFKRASDVLPPKTEEIRPHPEGLELGTLMRMAKATKSSRMSSFLKSDFSRISDRVAKEICDRAQVPPELKPANLTIEQAKQVIDAIAGVKIMAPETTCLSPIGDSLIKKGLKNVLEGLKPSFYAPPVTRKPRVYAGNPFQIEVGIVYGGEIPADQPVEILRFANRVPLLYQQGACAITAAVENVDWRNYGLEQRGGKGIPFGPAIVLVHFASTKVPFTSEAKEAIANVPEVREEIEQALRTCGRTLKVHLAKDARRFKTREKFEIVQKVLPKIAEKSSIIVGKPQPDLTATITKIMDIVWVDDKIEFSGKKHKVTIDIYNYTQTGKKLSFYAVVPDGHLSFGSVQPKAEEVKEGRISWDLKRIGSMDKATLTFELEGLEKEMYDENELYAAGIDPSRIIGAEPLPGDWGIKVAAPEKDEKEPTPDDEENGVDYDSAKEVVADE